MDMSVSSVAASASASKTPSAVTYTPEKASVVARSLDLAKTVTNEKLSLGDRMKAWEELQGYQVRAELANIKDEDRAAINQALDPDKSSLVKQVEGVWAEYSQVVNDSANRWDAAITWYDSLSADDKLLFEGWANAPLMNGKRFANMDVWRSTMSALGDQFEVEQAAKNDPSIARSRAGQLEELGRLTFNPDPAEVRSGAYAAKIRQILGQPLDSVSLSPQAQSLLGQGALGQSPQGGLQSPESIALMMMKGSMLNISA